MLIIRWTCSRCSFSANFYYVQWLQAPVFFLTPFLLRSCSVLTPFPCPVVLQPASRPQETLAQSPILDPSPLASPIAPDVSASTPVPGSEQWRVLPDVWDTLAADYPDSPALFDPHRSVHGVQPKLTFLEVWHTAELPSYA